MGNDLFLHEHRPIDFLYKRKKVFNHRHFALSSIINESSFRFLGYEIIKANASIVHLRSQIFISLLGAINGWLFLITCYYLDCLSSLWKPCA